ncbi:MAG: L-rhamnose isomerase [Mycoplasmatales bacterium]
MKNLNEAYKYAQDYYQKRGVDTEQAMKKMQDISISLHCWQTDDIEGFELSENLGGGGILSTGNFPGKARNIDEVKQDLSFVFSTLPGQHRLNLHAIYGDFKQKVERNEISKENFTTWVDFAKQENIALDFNPTLFAHEKAQDGLTLASPKKEIRDFWIEHCKKSREIANYFGEELNTKALCNIWIPDGLKDVPADRMGPRKRLKSALDEILNADLKFVDDSVESKLFGIASESYVVGSHDFYMNYTANSKAIPLLDMGHYHPTENVSDKLSAAGMFNDKIALHLSRPVRWDSDHVIALNEEVMEVAKELVRNNQIKDTYIGLDFFDATINRINGYVIGTRNVLKAFLFANLFDHESLKKAQDNFDFTTLITEFELAKSSPFSIVWDKYCLANNIVLDNDLAEHLAKYTQKNINKRG